MAISIFTDYEQVSYHENDRHSFSFVYGLLQDNDPDTVLQAIQVLDHLKDPRALTMLRALLHHPDVNIVQAAIITISHLGNDSVLSDITPFLKSDSPLKKPAIQALGDLRSSQAVRPLAHLLSDPATGLLAAEALARIGGITAFRALSKHWLKFHGQPDTETILGLMAHVIEGLAKKPSGTQDLRTSIIQHLNGSSVTMRLSAAQCILALGPGPGDKKALATLESSLTAKEMLPPCLKNRHDLIPYLLNARGMQRVWGFQLVSRFPKDAPVACLKTAMEKHDHIDHLESIVHALLKIKDPEIVPAVLDLYIRIPVSYRYVLNPLLRMHKKILRSLLIDTDVDDETRLVISSFLGISPICIALEILDLLPGSRIHVLSQITDSRSILKALPWLQWIEENPGIYAPVAAEVAVKANLRELMPVLRKILAVYPAELLIRAVGEFRDEESIPSLVVHLHKTSSHIRCCILEALGRIGGDEARKALRNCAVTMRPEESELAYKALTKCATEEDSAFFRNAASLSNWCIRVSCADFFSRYPLPENMESIAELANDPLPIVAQRSLFLLKSRLSGLEKIHRNIRTYKEGRKYGITQARFSDVTTVNEYCTVKGGAE